MQDTAAFYGEGEPKGLMKLIGSEDWPDSIVEACAELLRIFGPEVALRSMNMTGWIN